MEDKIISTAFQLGFAAAVHAIRNGVTLYELMKTIPDYEEKILQCRMIMAELEKEENTDSKTKPENKG